MKRHKMTIDIELKIWGGTSIPQARRLVKALLCQSGMSYGDVELAHFSSPRPWKKEERNPSLGDLCEISAPTGGGDERN